MDEAVLLIGRGLQFASAMLLFGAPLFGLYALGPAGEGVRLIRSVTLAALVVGLAAAVLVLMGEATSMSGAPGDLLRPAAWMDVLSGTQYGRVWTLRLGLLAAMGVSAIWRSRRWPYLLMIGIGALLAASLAWMGHGAADEGGKGAIHLFADALHILAAAAWLGALVPMALLITRAREGGRIEAAALARRGLERFSGVGTATVAVLVASGLVNGWLLIGPDIPRGLTTTRYGLVLSAKLVVFAGMLALAASNRWRATPHLAQTLDTRAPPRRALESLEFSLATEIVLAFGVLALVAWLGTLAPELPAS